MFQITILTSQSSKEMVKQLENKLKDVDLVSLRRIQVIEILKRDFLEPEDVEQHMPAEEPSSNGEHKTDRVLGEVMALDSRTTTSSCFGLIHATFLCAI